MHGDADDQSLDDFECAPRSSGAPSVRRTVQVMRLCPFCAGLCVPRAVRGWTFGAARGMCRALERAAQPEAPNPPLSSSPALQVLEGIALERSRRELLLWQELRASTSPDFIRRSGRAFMR